MNYTVDEIIELAKEVEVNDQIEWDNLPLDKDRIYQIVGSQVYDIYAEWTQTDKGEAVLIATITKLVVENFILTLKLESR